MELHKAQHLSHGQGTVSHLPGLFLKKSAMDWPNRQKVVWHELDENVRRYDFSLDGRKVVAFYNTSLCFFGFPKDEGFRPLTTEELARLKAETEAERANANHTSSSVHEPTQGSQDYQFRRAQAYSEVGRLLQERPYLTGAKLAANTRRIRELVEKYNIQCPVGI